MICYGSRDVGIGIWNLIKSMKYDEEKMIYISLYQYKSLSLIQLLQQGPIPWL